MPGLGRTIMVNDPAVLEHVLKTNFWAYEKGPVLRDSLEDLLGGGIFGADGQVKLKFVSGALIIDPLENEETLASVPSSLHMGLCF